jgi:carbamoyltransferase
VAAAAADLLARGNVIAWVQGRMEYGARALGHRSILASPVDRVMRDKVNTKVKHREEFRPFAGSVPVEFASRFFDMDGDSPFMQQVVPVRPEAEKSIEAISHFGTCRAQTVSAETDPLFHALLIALGRRTGIPVLLNTSFNDADEPMVRSARDALRSFSRMNLDGMVLGSCIVTRKSEK